MSCTLICMLIMANALSTSFGAYNVDYLMDKCVSEVENRTLYLGMNGSSTYGIIRLTRDNDYPQNLNCSMRVVAPSNYTLNIDVTYVDIYVTNTQFCIPDYLLVSGPLNIHFKYCGSGVLLNEPNVLTLDNWFDVRFVSGNISHEKDSGFELHYNLFHTGKCDSDDFVCANGVGERCILSELTCDSRNNCGDNSDEWTSTCGLSAGAITVIVLISLLIAATIAAVIASCVCEKKRKKQIEQRRRDMRNEMWSSSGVVLPSVHYDSQRGATIGPPPAYTISADTANMNNGYDLYGDVPIYSLPYSSQTVPSYEASALHPSLPTTAPEDKEKY